MNEKDALRILEKAKGIMVDGVTYAGSFYSTVSYENARNTKKEYNAAVRFLQKEFIKKQSSN